MLARARIAQRLRPLEAMVNMHRDTPTSADLDVPRRPAGHDAGRTCRSWSTVSCSSSPNHSANTPARTNMFGTDMFVTNMFV
ncbi:hypothetical protein A6F59_19925 [Prescottella equi]|nr:hypothetical protein A6F59_19925 [Prescottella equi]